MNACGHLSILCILLFDLQPAFCNEFAKRDVPNGHDEISGGDFFKSWLNSKQRRSVKSVGDRGLKALKQTRQIKPQFECGDLVFKVFLKQDDVVNLRISGPRGDLLRLEQLSAFCGVAIKTSHTDVHLLFSYDSCYVKPEESGYVLSLSWYGTEQALSCPRSRTPPSVVCKNNAMEMTLAGDGRADELSVALNGEWAPLLYVAAECWHRERSYQGQLTFSVPYSSCGVYFRDGHFILVLKSKGQMIPLSCPYEPKPGFPVKNPGFSETTQPPPQKQLRVYHKEPIVFPVEQQQRNLSGSPHLHPRSRWLPKLPSLPSLPGSFNLSVNFPFSLPMQKEPVLYRDPTTSKQGVLTPEPVPRPTFKPIIESTVELTTESTPELTTESATESLPEPTREPENEHRQSNLEQMEHDLAAAVTIPPYHVAYPNSFERPASSRQSRPSFVPKNQFSRVPVPSSSLYPFGSAQNYNFPDRLKVNPSLDSIAQYLPPGYFICSHNPPPPVHPERFLPPVPNPLQPLQFQIPSYQKPDITWFAPSNPAVPPMTVYPKPLTSAVASNPHQLFQPAQYFQPAEPHLNFYRGSYGPLGSTSTRQSPERLYPSSPALQEDGPSSPKRVQKPGQQPWSTSHRPVKKPSQEPKPLVPASRRTPDVLEYLTGGDESLELYQRSFEDASGIEIPSHSQYRPTLLSADVSTRKTGSRHMGFFQPRSIAPVPSPQAPTFTGNRPIMSLPQPMPRFFSVKEGAPVAQLPYSQGPSVRGMQLAPVYSEKPSEASSQKPQNATLPPHQFFRPASLEKDIFGSPLFRSTSQEVQPPKDASHSYFYSPSAAEALN
ncbi:proline-rich extensin-like protein EPR1 [Pimephales promelas]|uniref:proline-rich extensin-like protein EPR1 n=1 Tax=Pimephales promelas TaxID=90988 RepID=UPI001955946E|nr:proline-rich extensin-like protein EPR1 [Pimephales promelas]